MIDVAIGVALGLLLARAFEQVFFAWRARRQHRLLEMMPPPPRRGMFEGLLPDPKQERLIIDQLVRIIRKIQQGIDGEEWKQPQDGDSSRPE
jgi:hypothetical protein